MTSWNKFKKKIILELVSPRINFVSKFFIYIINFILGFIRKKKENKKSPCLIWDARREPITFDFTCFILNAYNVFHKQGFKYFDLVIYFPKDFFPHSFKYENYNLFVDSDQISRRVKEIIYKLAESYSCIKNIKIVYDCKTISKIIQKSSFVYPYNYHPKYFQPRTLDYRKIHSSLKKNDKYVFPEIVSKKNCSKKMSELLISLEKSNFITLTLRDYGFSPLRNTTNKDLVGAKKLAKKLNFKLILIPDDKRKLINYDICMDSLISFSAREDLDDRIYLYAKSKLNIFQTGGPSYVPLFIRGSKSVMLDVGKAGFDNDEKHWKNDHNLFPGDQPYKKLECYMMWYRFYKEYSSEDLYQIYKTLYSNDFN